MHTIVPTCKAVTGVYVHTVCTCDGSLRAVFVCVVIDVHVAIDTIAYVALM